MARKMPSNFCVNLTSSASNSNSCETSTKRQSRTIKKTSNAPKKNPIRRKTRDKSKSGTKTKNTAKSETKTNGASGKKRKNTTKSETKSDEELEKILGVTQINGHREFLMKWKGQEVPTLVRSEVAKYKYTHAVLDFYETCLVWEDIDLNNTTN